MPRALVTGAAGFIGSHLCEYLLARGYSVVGMDNLLTGDLSNIEHLWGRDFVFVKHDVTNYVHVEGPLDVIFHFASPASPIDYLRVPIQTLKVGSLGTHKALGLARSKGARFLLASTSEVYGDPLVHPQREDYWGNVNPVGPRGVYDEAKRFSEAMVMAYHRSHGINTHIVRIFNTFGPRMRLDDGRVLPNFMGQALRGEPLTVYGDGSQTRSFCFVDDLIDDVELDSQASGHRRLDPARDEEDDMHAVVIRVSIKDPENAETDLKEEVVPQVSQAPGFVAGYWTRKEQTGLSMVVFESEDAAKAASDRIQSGIPDTVELQDVEVREVVANA